MMQNRKLTKENFISAIESLNFKLKEDYDFLYEVYLFVCDAIYEVIKNTDLPFTPVNDYIVILYILNEYTYSLSTVGADRKEEFKNSDDFFNILSSICADKYLTNEKLNYKSKAFINRFNVPISTLDLYLNFVLRSLENNSPRIQSDKLVKDMLLKGFSMAKCILSLLIGGFETEAFSTWRTLHENECILLCLMKNGDSMFKEYYKHIKYALAYRGQFKSKEYTDKIFVDIKTEMKEHELKSKDMKKFIEYGYLYAAKNLEDFPNFKLNFRDGVESIAGLSNYSKVYEMASEIAHSSPVLLYSNKSYFYEVTMLNLYESFFRLETIFEAFYRASVSQEMFNKYLQLKKLYMSQLSGIYKKYKADYLSKYTSKEVN